MTSLVLVAGHAISYRFDRLDRDEGLHLKPFQAAEGPLYPDHVRRGVELAATQTDSLLLFAGGQTDASAGPRSEGQGYRLAAEHHEWFGYSEVRQRAGTEEFSLDSFQNLLYGIAVTGKSPGAGGAMVGQAVWPVDSMKDDRRNRLSYLTLWLLGLRKT
jgi:hypothetical protein